MWKVAVVLSILAIGASASDVDDQITPFVRGGRDALIGEFPSDVSVETPWENRCQGVLISDRHVLLAASCVVNATDRAVVHPVWFRVIAGDRNLFQPSNTRVVRTVSHVYPHDQYNSQTNAFDIAVLRLSTPFDFPHITIEEAIMQTRIVADGVQCQFSGWGTADNATNTMNAIKRVINAPIVNTLTCNGVTFAHPGRVLEHMICAGNTVGAGNPVLVTEAVCRGDVGGGLYCNNLLTGILSFGLGCGNPNHPGIYIQVRLVRPWIDQQLVRTDTIPPGTLFPRTT